MRHSTLVFAVSRATGKNVKHDDDISRRALRCFRPRPRLNGPVRFVAEVGRTFMTEVLRCPLHFDAVTAETRLLDFLGRFPGDSIEAFELRVIIETVRVFGVDPQPVLDRPLPEIFHYLRQHRPPLELPTGNLPHWELLPFER